MARPVTYAASDLFQLVVDMSPSALAPTSTAPLFPFSLAQHFLIATPDMDDRRFQRSVIYLWEHGMGGASGLCINQPGAATLSHLMQQIQLPLPRADLQHMNVGWGGPLHPERGFVLHSAMRYRSAPLSDADTDADTPTTPLQAVSDAASEQPAQSYQSSITLPDGLQLTTSRDILSDFSEGTGPQHILPVLGYASWGAGQLDKEYRAGYWLAVQANHHILFHTPIHARYQAACALLGIHNFALLTRSAHE